MNDHSEINGKKILMICYYYPPLTDVGSQRSVAFSKYFKKYGWHPYVLTIKNPDKNFCSIGNISPPDGIHIEYSYSILNIFWFIKIVQGLMSKICKLLHIELKRNYIYEILAIPDIFWGWIIHSIIKGTKIVVNKHIDIMYVSCSPFSSAIIGVFLKFLTRRKLVLDFRDPFALKTISFYNKTKLSKAINESLEKMFLKFADVLILTTDETRQAYIEQYPHYKNKIFTVHNGFDNGYIPNNHKKYSKFTIVYGGNLYFFTLNNKFFFEAIALLKKREKIEKSNFKFLYYGGDKERVEKMSIEYGIKDLVIANKGIPHKYLLNAISKSHLQLLRIVKPMISTKLFEGIALNTPFLAVIPQGEVQDIITKYSPGSCIINEESSERVCDAILNTMDKYGKNEIANNRIQEFLKEFSRENLTLKLKKIMEDKLL